MPTKYDCGGFVPSDDYTELTLKASGSSYTATHNGYVTFIKTSTAKDQYIDIAASTISQIWSTNQNEYLGTFVPIRKGKEFKISYTAGGTTQILKHYYNIGQTSIIKY